MSIQFIHNIERALSEQLPGKIAHLKMAPLKNEAYQELPKSYKTACVLILLYLKKDKWHSVLIQRSTTDLNDKHSGQLSLPGGKLDESDASYEDCALRETYEEIGVPPESIGILGALTPIYVYVSNFYVHPFVGFTTESPIFTKQDLEVAEIIEIPLEIITNPNKKKVGDINVRNIVIKETPYYDVFGQKLWGATAMIMSEMEEILKTSELS